MTDATYIRTPLRPMTIASDIREMADAFQISMMSFGSQLHILNSQLANEYYNCVNNAYAAMLSVADRKELQTLYGITDGNSVTVDLYTVGADQDRRNRLFELFSTYFYSAKEDDPKRADWYNVRTGAIKAVTNKEEVTHNGLWLISGILHCAMYDDWPLNADTLPTRWLLRIETDHRFTTGDTYHRPSKETIHHQLLPHCDENKLYDLAISLMLGLLGDRYVLQDWKESIDVIYQKMFANRHMAKPAKFNNIYTRANEYKETLAKQGIFLGSVVGDVTNYTYITGPQNRINRGGYHIAFYITVSDGAVVTQGYNFIQRNYQSFDNLNWSMVDLGNRDLTNLFGYIDGEFETLNKGDQLEFEI